MKKSKNTNEICPQIQKCYTWIHAPAAGLRAETPRAHAHRTRVFPEREHRYRKCHILMQ